MVTLAKPIAGGLPMGAVLMTDQVAAVMKPGDHGTTFGGGPLVASVALHVVKRLVEPALLEQVTENGAWMGEELRAIMRRTGRARAVRGIGLMWGMDVVEPAAGVVSRAMDAGLLILSAGEYTLRLLPPLVMTREDLREGLESLEEVLR
jgi:acetylornithine/succinyldiaminopimelate/putrescine aminotransferase